MNIVLLGCPGSGKGTQAKIFQEELPLFQMQKTFQVETSIFPGRKFQATLKQFGSAFDPQTKKLSAFLALPNPTEDLRIGLGVIVNLNLPLQEP